MGSRYHTVREKKRTGRIRSSASRPKTFKNEDAAKNWAKENGISKFTLLNLKSEEATEKKIRVIPE